jgi:hypothetical protein
MKRPVIDTESREFIAQGSPDVKLAADISAYLPKLSKKGTLFKPSPATATLRNTEYHALIDALLSDSLPPAVRALREDRLIHDFFGYWRRDYDYAQKAGIPTPVVVNPIPISTSAESKRPARLNAQVMFAPGVSGPPSPMESSIGTPSLTSGDSVDICSCGIPTPTGSDGWSSTFRKVTYPPAALQDLIAQEELYGQDLKLPRYRKKSKPDSPGLLVRVDTTEEVFVDRSNALVLSPSFEPFPIPSSPAVDAPGPSSPRTPLMSSQSGLSRVPRIFQATNTVQPLPLQSEQPISESPPLAQWAPLRTRLQSLPSSPPAQDDELSKRIPGLQPVPGPGTSSAKIMVFSANDFNLPPPPPVTPPTATRDGLPIPPSSLRRRAMSSAAADAVVAEFAGPVVPRDSGGTFGGYYSDNIRRSLSQSNQSNELLATPTDERPVSTVSSDPSSAEVARYSVNKVTSVPPPKVVWIKRSPQPLELMSNEMDDPTAAGLSGEATPRPIVPSPTESAPVVRVGDAAIRKSQLDAYLDMDVSQRRWWRKTESDSPSPEVVNTPSEQQEVLIPHTQTPRSFQASQASQSSKSVESREYHTANSSSPSPMTSNEAIMSSGSSSANARQALVRSSSISAYAHSIEVTRRSDPLRIQAWALRVPTGVRELPPVVEQQQQQHYRQRQQQQQPVHRTPHAHFMGDRDRYAMAHPSSFDSPQSPSYPINDAGRRGYRGRHSPN